MKPSKKHFAAMLSALLVMTGSVFGQQWNGAANETGDIYRTGRVGIGITGPPLSQLHVRGNHPVRIVGELSTLSGSEFVDFMARSLPFNSYLDGMRIQRDSRTGDVNTIFFAAAAGTGAAEKMRIGGNGNVGIGTADPAARLEVIRPQGAVPSVETCIRGETSSSYGEATGVIGIVNNVWSGQSSAGVRGINKGTGGSGFGVYASHAGTGHALHAEVPSRTEGYAGWFNGRVQVSGTLSKIAGSFKIDHPLDPSNKYLYHSFVESPDMKNIYDGVAVLDTTGEAWVELPDWFEALNRDFRYQLTAIGAPAPNLYIAKEVSPNGFKIAGGEPGMKVSWQITGIRRDPYAEKYRIPVEEEKPAAERGHYLVPEVYGLPIELSVERAQQAGAGPYRYGAIKKE